MSRKQQLFSLLSLLSNIAIVILVCISVRILVFSGSGNMTAIGAQSLRYFTVLSNILAALTALPLLPGSLRGLLGGAAAAPQWALICKYVGTVSVSVTLFTVLLFLGPTQGYAIMFVGCSLYLHAIVPILAMLSFALFDAGAPLRFSQSLLGLLPTVLYSVVYLVMVVIARKWPDFYGFTFGGQNAFIPLSMIAMYLLTFALGSGLWKLRALLR